MKIGDVLYIIIGNFILTLATYFFVLPNNILNGGTAGLAIAIEPLFHLNTVVMTNVFTVGLFIIGAFFLGKQFALNTLVSTISYPLFLSLFSMAHVHTVSMPMYIASIYSGVLSGIGLGLTFRVNASTGGMDVPALILAKYTQMKQGDAVMIVDVLTVLLGIFTYGLVPALIGMISVYVSGLAINRTVTIGAQPAKNVMIISERWQKIERELFKDIERGVTELNAKGGYTKHTHPILMCVIRQKQYPKLEQIVNEIDPNAFIIVHDVQQVKGEGFSWNKEI